MKPDIHIVTSGDDVIIIDTKYKKIEKVKTTKNNNPACLDETSSSAKYSSKLKIHVDKVVSQKPHFEALHGFEIRFQDDIDD